MPLSVAKNKCKNFFVTLIDLATKTKSMDIKNQITNEIQHLMNGQTNPRTFLQNVARMINTQPQLTLVPFLIRTLPEVRKSLQSGEFVIGE